MWSVRLCFNNSFVSTWIPVASFSCNKRIATVWKVSKYGVFLVRIFPYPDWIQENADQKKTTHLDTFHTESVMVQFRCARSSGWFKLYISCVAVKFTRTLCFRSTINEKEQILSSSSYILIVFYFIFPAAFCFDVFCFTFFCW